MMTENAIKTIFNFFANLAEFAIAMVYFNNFLRAKAKNKAVMIILGFVFSILYTIVNNFGNPVLNSICGFAMLFICSRIIFSDNWTTGFSITAIYAVLAATAELLIGFFVLLTSNLSLLHIVGGVKAYIIIYILSKALLLSFVFLLIKKCPRKYYTQSSSNIMLLSSFPILSLVAMYTLLDYSSRQPISFIENIFIIGLLVCILLSSIISFFVFDNLLLNAHLKAQLDLSNKARQVNKAIYDEKERSFEISKSYIHEFKKNLFHIHSLYEKGDNKNAVLYENQLLESLDAQTEATILDIGNPIISDSIVRAQLLCKMEGIDFNYNIAYNKLDFIEFLDASTLFDNIIDNAFYACKNLNAGKWITLSLKAKDNNIYLSARNAKDNRIVKDNGKFLSGKRDYKEFGMGIENIRAVAEKYNGDIVTEYLDTEFHIAVRLEILTSNDIVLTEKRESFV